MKRTVIIYGNCQCVVVRDVLVRFLPADDYEVIYIMDKANPTRGDITLPKEKLDSCVMLFEQWTEWDDPFPFRDQLPAACPVARLPSLQFLTFWPLEANDPRNRPEPPDFPYGRYLHGDRLALSLLQKAGGDPDEALRRYRDTDLRQQVDLDRLQEMMLERIQRMDAITKADFRGYIDGNFRTRRLFWTPGHPTAAMLAQIALIGTRALGLAATEQQIEDHLAGNETYMHLPVHPQVIEHFGLTCVTPQTRYKYIDGREFTFDEWMFHYLHGF